MAEECSDVKKVEIGKHYALEMAIIKVYNVTDDGLVGGMVMDLPSGGVWYSKGFRPNTPAWEGYVKDLQEDVHLVVKLEHVGEEIPPEHLAELSSFNQKRMRYFFSDNTEEPFCTWSEFLDFFRKMKRVLRG